MRRTFIASLLFTLIGLNLAATSAQQIPFLSELISRSEQFYALYGEKRRAGANLSALEPVRLRGEEAFRRGNVPAMLEVLGEGLALLAGRQWDEKHKFLYSLALEPDRSVIEPNRDLQVSLVRMFQSNADKAFASPPTVTFEIRPLERDATTASSSLRLSKPVVLTERLAIAEASTNANRRLLLPDDVYWLVARIEAGGQPVAEIKKFIYAIGNFSDRLAELRKALAAIKGSTDPKVKAVAPLSSTPEFQLQRLSTLNQTRGEDSVNPIEELDRIEAALSSLSKGQNPYSTERGEAERAYLASDGKLVPFRVYVPQSYDGSSPRPLVVMLHGALGDEKMYFSGLYDPAVIKGEAERRGYILAAVNGRGRFSTYGGLAEEDVFAVIRAVTRDYRIEPSRIYLTGHSLGAGGTWAIASSRPEMFAAIAPVSGGGPAQMNAASQLFEKVKGIAALVVHGARDGIVPPEGSRNMAAAAQKAGLKVTYLEVPDTDHITVVAASFPAILDFFDKNSKKL